MATSGFTLQDLRKNAENWAFWLRLIAIVLALLALAPLGGVAFVVLPDEPKTEIALWWGIAKLAGGVAVSALLLFAVKLVWDFSNVWLGRAGTLEDLRLALSLLGADQADPKVPDGKAEELLLLVESLRRLRRGFEGELLKGPALWPPKGGG